MSQIIPKVDAAALASVASLAGENILTEDELSLVGSGAQGGFAFDGSNDYLSGPSDDFGTSDFTLVYDVLWDDAPSGVEYVGITSSGNNRWYFYVTATQYILKIVDNAGATNTYTWSITPSVNHRNVIISADRSGNATLYLNGASQGTQDISATSSVDLGSGNTSPLRIGHNTTSFDGKMFQVRYYLEAKTSAQVLNIAKGYNDTDNLFLKLAPTSTNAHGWTDLSGNNRNFTANGVTRIESNISKKYVSENEVSQNLIATKSRYYFDGDDRIDNIGEEALNTNDWTWLAEANPSDTSGLYGILYGLGSGGFTNRRYLRYNNGAYDVTIGDSSATVIEIDWPAEPAVVVVTHQSSTSTVKIYINGEFIKSATHSNQFDVGSSPISTNGVDVGSIGGGSFFKGEILRVQTFNRVLTNSEIIDISKGKRLEYADVGADGTSATSGTLTVGKRYRLTDFIAGDDFTNVGAASNADGVEFIATGTTPNTWTNSSQVTQLGEVLALLPESAATGKWYNESGAGSSGDGTVTGATLINERKRGVFDDLYLDNVPSSDAGLVAGEVYRDNNGHLKIVI